MIYKHIEQLDKPVSSLIFGTAALGSESGYQAKFFRKERQKIYSLLDFAYEQGYNTFDTAAVYMLGESEKILGEWINANGIRQDIVLISKGSHPKYFLLPSIIYNKARLTKQAIDCDLEKSLKRLNTDYIDIYMPHRDNEDISVEKIMDIFSAHVSSGKIKVLGCSNWNHNRIEQANHYALKNNLNCFTVSSPHYSLFNWSKAPWAGTISISGSENSHALDWYAAQKIPIFAWSPLAGGINHFLQTLNDGPYHTYRNKSVMKQLLKLSNESGFTVESLILSWMSKQTSPIIFPIIKSTCQSNVRANAQSQSLTLPQHILGKLTELSKI